MKFTYETQGAITYLVCELENEEQVDKIALGMLTNNHIVGLAPVLYTEMNSQRFLKYNISAKVSSDQFFSGTMNKQRTLNAFQNILSAICSVDEYMIDQNCFSILSEHIFLNVSNCETAMICIPVTNDKDINSEVSALFKKIMFSSQFDNNEDASYITQIITYVNSGESFTVYGLKDLIDKLYTGTSVSASAVQQAPVMQQIPISTVQQPVIPVSSFDSTISIDDMPAMMAQKKQATQQQTPVIPTPPSVKTNPQQISIQPNVTQTGRSTNNDPIPIQNSKAPQGGIKPPQQPVNTPKTPVQNTPVFAIPGQPMGSSVRPSMSPVSTQKQQLNAEHSGEKKISFFGLLSHYNKENVELYKRQKEEAKAKKSVNSKKNVQPPNQPFAGNMYGTGVAKPNQVDRPNIGSMGQQQFTPPQYHPPVQPVPVQNSFNETTVLSPVMVGGETTVLSATPGVANPCITRLKTGERISINKPVFRIGKEKSYVDYFIADNTAISRSHCNIHTENGEYFIEDTNSTNHTYVNGKLINSNIKTKIVSGDKIKLANEEFTFAV